MSAADNGRGFDLSGLGLRVRGLPQDLDAWLVRAWRGFLCDTPPEPALDVEIVRQGAVELTSPSDAKAIRGEIAGDRAVYALPEGAIEVRGHRATLRLRTGEATQARTTVENLLRAGLAWWLPRRQGLMLHAAGAVIDGRAFVLVGPADSGKSTFAALAESAGAAVLSDDVVVVQRGASGFEALGAPFRSTHERLSGPGRWPVAAVLLPEHGSAPALAPVGSLRARARLLANLPFAVDAYGRDAVVEAVLDRLVAEVPARRLTFARDAGFVELLRQRGF